MLGYGHCWASEMSEKHQKISPNWHTKSKCLHAERYANICKCRWDQENNLNLGLFINLSNDLFLGRDSICPHSFTLYGTIQHGHSSKLLLLCCMEEKESNAFRTTWRCVNIDNIFGWTLWGGQTGLCNIVAVFGGVLGLTKLTEMVYL